MKKKTIWLVASCFMVAALVLASCAPAAVEEEEEAVPATGTAEQHNERGVASFEVGQYEQAVTEFNKAIELDPEYAEAYGNRRFVCYLRGNYVWSVHFDHLSRQ